MSRPPEGGRSLGRGPVDDEPAERILVGLIARAHGLKGEVVVEVTSDAPERYRPGSLLTARMKGGAGERRVRVESTRPFQHRLLVRFEGVESREDAEALHGAELTIDRGDVAPLPEGQHYRFELIGLRVASKDGRHLGVVSDVFGTGSNDVLAIDGAKGEILVPMLPGVIVSVDVAGGAMVVDPPAGLPGLES